MMNMMDRPKMKNTEDTKPTLRVPEGGLKVGLPYNDLTQLMTDVDAQLVRERLSVRERSGPGLLLFGLACGVMWGAVGTDGRAMLISGLIGGLSLPLIVYSATRMGFYDRRTLRAAEKAIQKAKQV